MSTERFTTNFLNTLQLVYVIVRAKPEGTNNLVLVRTFDKYIDDGISINRKMIRHLIRHLSSIVDLDFIKSIKMDLNKFWVNHKIEDIGVYKENIPVLKDINKELLGLLEAADYNRARDLANAIHNYPEMLVKSENWKASDFWEVFIVPYRKSWDSKFFDKWKERFIKI